MPISNLSPVWATLMAFAFLALSPRAALAVPTLERWTHASGAEVYLVSTDALPMLDLQLDLDGGGRRDPTHQTGLAAATAAMLSAGVRAKADAPALDENALTEAWLDLGAQLGASAGTDRFSLTLRTLTEPELLQGAIALAARQLADPAFPEAVWARERERLLAALREADTRPGTLAGRVFGQAVYGDHPYGREPRAETLQAITVADLKEFHRRHLQACRARVSLVGSVDRATADALVGRLMAGLAGRPCEALPPVVEVEPLTVAVDRRLPFDAAQAQILVGQPGLTRRDPDFLAFLVGNHILGGGGFVSRLTTEVREKRGLSYSVYSHFAPGLHAGAFQIGLSTRPDQAEQALGIVREVVRRFVTEGPTEAELQAAKDNLINGFALRLDSNRKLLDNVTNIAWNGLPLSYLDTWPAQVQALGVDDIRRVFQRVLQSERMVTVVVGGR